MARRKRIGHGWIEIREKQLGYGYSTNVTAALLDEIVDML
jgi:hypothetical protein